MLHWDQDIFDTEIFVFKKKKYKWQDKKYKPSVFK
jgi:hypothetical protein